MTQFQQIGPNRYWVKSHTEDPYLIYALVDPRTNRIKYIGKTITGMRRIFEHFKPSSLNEGNTRKNNWIKSLLKQGLKPDYCILLSFNSNESKEIVNKKLYWAEQILIQAYKLDCPNDVLNHTDGGEGCIGRIVSEETRKKMSESAKKRPLPQALLDQQKPKGLPKKPRKKSKSRAIPGARQKYANSMKHPVIAKNIQTDEIIEFAGLRDAAKIIGGKCNKGGIKLAIEHNRQYYGYSWSKKCF